MVQVDDRMASVDDGFISDSPMTVTRLGNAHETREAALAKARRIAASSTENTVVVEEANRFRVAMVDEIDREHGIVDARAGTLAVVAGNDNGVRVRGTSDSTTHFDTMR